MLDRILNRRKPEPHDEPVTIPPAYEDPAPPTTAEMYSEALHLVVRMIKEAVPDTPPGEPSKDQYRRITLRMVLMPSDARTAYLGVPDWSTDPSAEAVRAAVNLILLSKAADSPEREAAMTAERNILDAAKAMRRARERGMA